jgi:hypothetical protein
MYYILERSNPQLKNVYYRAKGRLTKKDALKKENAYGSVCTLPFKTKEEYIEACEKYNLNPEK